MIRIRSRLVLVGLLWLAASCTFIDAGALTSFECDDAGHCKTTILNGPDGGSGSKDGGAGDGGTGDGGGTTQFDGGLRCSASNCAGCCDGENQCQTGDSAASCGLSGEGCALCTNATGCQAGICQPLKANASSCSAGVQCVSGSCVGGLCCSTPCTGACEACNLSGSEGVCTVRSEGASSDACGAYACDGLHGGCPAFCTTSQQCAAGRFCISGTCQQTKPIGTACETNLQCQSGFCADRVCCDSSCSRSCDRCDVPSNTGTCRPSPASDPGTPACGGAVVCNGTLTDCPILCTAGCPSGTWCSGTYCSAKKTDGTSCGSATECTSGFCAGGLCCNSGCTGACETCSAAQGASADGHCTLFGPSHICRSAASVCDVADRCDGTRASCPSDVVTDAGVTCATTTVGGWSSCSYGSICTRTGSRTRPTTSYACASGMCGSTSGSETDTSACARVTEGTSCNATQYGTWSGCAYPVACGANGTRTRSVTTSNCNAGGTCSPVTVTETDTASCTRTVEGSACGAVNAGAWSACTYASQCETTGLRTRSVTTPTCIGGTCSNATTTETDSSACTRGTEAQSCGTTTYGGFGACSYAQSCSTSGSRTRTMTSYACTSGTCSPSNGTDTDTSGCTRSTAGDSCGTTTYGTYSTCDYAMTCSNSGTRTRSVSTYTCGAGSCNTGSSTETDTTGCNRNANGESCGVTTYGSYTACSYSSGCSDTGSRTRLVTQAICNGGACGSSTMTETDVIGCNRSTGGSTCSAPVYGPYGTCSYATACTNTGQRTRTATTYTCGSGACNGVTGNDNDTSGCARSTLNVECVPPSCGSYGQCDSDCFQHRNCTHSVCNSSEVCEQGSYNQACGKNNGCCMSCVPA